jgi:hypothetical protein
MRNELALIPLFALVTACSSVPPKYEKMRTVEDAVNEFDQDRIQPGMAITKKGAVVDIQVEEIQEQKRKLIEELAVKDQKIRSLEERLAETQTKYQTLRIYLGLSPTEPKPEGQCCDGYGRIIDFKAAPTLDQELATLPKRIPAQVGKE